MDFLLQTTLRAMLQVTEWRFTFVIPPEKMIVFPHNAPIRRWQSFGRG